MAKALTAFGGILFVLGVLWLSPLADYVLPAKMTKIGESSDKAAAVYSVDKDQSRSRVGPLVAIILGGAIVVAGSVLARRGQ